jgi:hypothetical protein
LSKTLGEGTIAASDQTEWHSFGLPGAGKRYSHLNDSYSGESNALAFFAAGLFKNDGVFSYGGAAFTDMRDDYIRISRSASVSG